MTHFFEKQKVTKQRASYICVTNVPIHVWSNKYKIKLLK